MKKIGFYGGSFDPIHFGHLNLAIRMMEEGELDEVLFCPAYQSPFKGEGETRANGYHRFEMLKVVLADIQGFSVTTFEIDRPGPSYTVETLRRLRRDSVQYRLILSEETAKRFFEWKSPAEILQLAPPLIGSRAGEPLVDPALKNNLIKMPLFDISSTDIRQRFKKGLYCGHLVPAKALDYIARHRLYSDHEKKSP